MNLRTTYRCLGLVLAAALTTAPAVAQDQAGQGVLAGDGASQVVAPDTEWGTFNDILLTIASPDFHLFQGTESPLNVVNSMRSCALAPPANCGWLAGVQLPSGASVRAVRWAVCDTDAASAVQFGLFRAPKPAGAVVPVSTFGNSGAAPGCVTITQTLATPHTVDNANNVYLADVLTTSGNLGFVSATIAYRLQVSPAPATATFGDVPPTHAFFRFVEALAASGITGGCGGGNYCPDAALTRGQMAVFLATALGLHFPF